MLGGSFLQWMLLLLLSVCFVPQVAWADDKLDSIFIDNKSYYVLSSASDWLKFRDKVDASNGREVNAIMDADFWVYDAIALKSGVYYNGTFNGNGHTLVVDIDGGTTDEMAPFSKVKEATFRDLRVNGYVKGGQWTGGLIGRVLYEGHPNVHIERVWVSVDVTSSKSHASGFIGHASKAVTHINDCRYDGNVSSNDYKACFIWADSGDERIWHRLYEEATSNGKSHFGFSYVFVGGDVWGEAWGGDDKCSLNLSSHVWTEMASGCSNITEQSDVLDKMNGEKPGSWHIGYTGTAYRATPVMTSWPAAGDVNFETYDMVPGTEDSEKGMLKIPFSCDQPVKYIDVSYTDENGQTKKLPRITYDKDTYAGFIPVSATERHKSLEIKAKLKVGTVTVTRKETDDAILHKPESPKASVLKFDTHKVLTDAGAVEVTWSVSNPKYNDILSGDEFMVLRSLTDKDDDYQLIGTVTFDEDTTKYSYKDSTLVSSLTEEQINGGSVTVYYRIVRAAAYQLWGFSYIKNDNEVKNPAMASTNVELSNLHLLKVKTDYTAKWENESERTVRVEWNYGTEGNAVWDSRAQMTMRLTTFNRDAEPVDTTTFVLTDEEITARKKVVQLNRSCVFYVIDFGVEMGKTITRCENPDQFTFTRVAVNVTIRSDADWDTFIQKVKEAEGKYDVNAYLMTDISLDINKRVGASDAPYRGTFEGNGHTIALNMISGVGQSATLFFYVGSSTFRNLNLTGTVSCSLPYTASLITFAKTGSNVTIENCNSTVNLTSSYNDLAYMGGFVGKLDSGQLTFNNCRFAGSFTGVNTWGNGGFVGDAVGNQSRVTINNCLFAPTSINTKYEECNTWVGSNSGTLTLNNSYCTKEYRPLGKVFIESSADWDIFCNLVREAKGSYDVNAVLLADITVTQAVGGSGYNYRGTFDGNGYTINMDINSDKSNFGLFAYAKGYIIKNLRLTGKIVSSGSAVGGLVGESYYFEEYNNYIGNCRVSAAIQSSGDASGFIAHINPSDKVRIMNCCFDGSIDSDKAYAICAGAMGGIIDAKIDKFVENGTYSDDCTPAMMEHDVRCDSDPDRKSNILSYHTWGDGSYSADASVPGQMYILLVLGDKEWTVDDGKPVPILHRSTYSGKTSDETLSILGSDKTSDEIVSILGNGWTKNANGQPVPKTNSVEPVIGDSRKITSGQFYYESLGQIITNSLKTETQQSSVVLTWEKTDDTVDYYRVERRNVTTDEEWKVIAPQVTELQYEDKTVSPVFDYEYRVSSVNDCEGLHITTTDVVAGNCVKTGKVEGYVRFADGSGIPGVRVSVSQTGKDADPKKGGSCVTDESGFYSVEKLEYWEYQKGAYTITLSGIESDMLSEDCKNGLPVTFNAESNYFNGNNFTVISGVRFTGQVMYLGTSIPVKGARFTVDGREVHTAAGPVESDFDGHFDFRMLPGEHTVQAVMKGHKFTGGGYYTENGKTKIEFKTDVANTYFYDSTQVTLIGRVAGGHVQGELPLGNSLSTNNLGDSLKIVLTLEGDNRSWLVFDNTNRSLTTRETSYTHKKHGQMDKNTYSTRVHTERHRMVVYPDKLTGEYEVKLPPVKWKIQQITAEGYATLFQDGETSDVIDLTDSLTFHSDTLKGNWTSRGGVHLDSVAVEYHAKYSRTYHSPVLLEYKQQGFDNFSYFGEKNFNYQPIKGVKEKIPVAYAVRKEGWPVGRKDSMEARYTFGHPVFCTDRGYGLTLSAIERYYYNNNPKSDTIDVVKLNGGFVSIRNGLMGGTQLDTLSLDSLGEGNYTLRANRTPYLLSGNDALCTVTFTMERDGTTFEGEPLRGYVFCAQTATGAQDLVSINQPILVDILRDPPGGGSSAKLSKGSTLKLAYQMDMAWKGGISIGINAGSGQDFYTGLWAGVGAGGNYGQIGHSSGVFNTSVDIVFSGSGQRAFSYTMTANEDISTDAGSTMVGAIADLYMGLETNIFVRPAVAIQAINDSAFAASAGALAAGRMVEIASGRDENDKLFHLVRSEVLLPGQAVKSAFVHSQNYIVNQLIPGLVEECRSQMYTGTLENAKAEANRRNQRIYLSLVPETDEERFGVVNTNAKGYVYHTTGTYKADDADLSKMNYVIVLPDGDNGTTQTDTIHAICNTIGEWVNMIARNEKEKLDVSDGDRMKNFDIDGGATLSYSEDFSTEYSNTSSYNWLATDFTHNYFANPDPANSDAYGDNERAQAAFATIGPLLGNTVGKYLAGLLNTSGKMKAGGTSVQSVTQTELKPLSTYEIKFVGISWTFSLTPVAAYGVTPKNTEATKYNRKESFTVKMGGKSHLNFDVYYVKMIDSKKKTKVDGKTDIFMEENFLNNVDYVKYFLERDVGSREIVDEMIKPRGFIYRTRGGATVRPWEPERKTLFERTGTILDERTKKIEKPVIKMDRQSMSGVPHGDPARFKLYMTNESEQPDAIAGPLLYYTLYLESKSNPKGAKMTVDGIPLSADGTTVKLVPGEVTEKTLEVWAGEDFDYENLEIGVISQGDVQCYDVVDFSVHYLPTAGNIEISSPGDKWIMNCDAPSDSKQAWYMPVIISGFDKNQKNFDHIEFQYKESTRGDDYWTNLCGYYADSTFYRAASGTKEMIPENGNIITKFYGEGTVMEKAYDLRARLYRRNGNSFITSDSKVLSGIKDTRRPQVFGQPDPKDGIIGAGDNIVFHFSEAIEHNYLQKATNFEVVGETNETALTEETCLLFEGNGYVQTDARRNFADKNMTIDMMVRPAQTNEDMPLFSHGQDGNSLQLWLTKDWKLRAVIDSVQFESSVAVGTDALRQVALVIDNDHKQALLWNDSIIGTLNDVTYSGYGPLIFGASNEVVVSDRKHYSGRMMEARVWNRSMTEALLNSYGKRRLTGYEMGLINYYPMDDGESNYAVDKAQGANAELHGATWALPRGMSLKLDWAEEKAVKGMHLDSRKMQRSAEQDYTLMLWFKTTNAGQGALISNGKGSTTDDDARNKFFLGFEYDQLIYRTNGRTLPLGKGLADDQWHHFAITVNRSHQVANLYVDRVLTQSVSTDTLGGMMGNDFYVGNMVWHEAGANVQTLHQENALAGHIDELCLFSQALPPALLKHYSSKCPTGREKGLLVRMGFARHERQPNNNIELRPYALNQLIKLDMDGNPTEEHDSVFVEPVANILAHIDPHVGAPIQFSQELRNLNFSFVGRDNQLLVNIDENDAHINKRNLYVTVTDVPDMNGNYMASPSTMAFYVDRNPLRWQMKRYSHEYTHNSYTDEDDIFTMSISNTSGASHTYTIDNMPRWMTVNQPTDIIGPKADQMLIFTISKDLNVGTYDEVIYLTDENGLSEPLSLTIRKEGVKPDWYVDDDLKHFSMNLVGQVKIGNAVVTDTKDMVAAFDGMNRCLGVANVSYNTATAKSQLFMTLFNDEATTGNVELTFKLWHHQTGQVMVLEPDREVCFSHSTVAGSVNDPVVMKGGSVYYQELNLNPGWNWISLNLDSRVYRDVIGMLSHFDWQDGDIVTDDTEDFTLVYKSSLNGWVANNSQKEGYSITPKRSYRVYVKNRVNVEVKGYPLRGESQRTLKVQHGWNNIGYTPMVNLPVQTALADYTGSARDGDVVKSREEFAIFTETSVGGGYWSGSLQYLKPGEGYMLYRGGEGEAYFRYPYYEPGSNFFERTAQTQARVALSEHYGHNMTMVATVKGIDVQEGDRLQVFSKNQLRGESVMFSDSTAEDAEPLFFLNIAGDTKTSLTFAIERDGQIIATSSEVMNYENNAVSGTPTEPTEVRFVKAEDNGNSDDNGSWYSLQGYKLNGKPQRKGIYIHNGKKQFVK